MLTDEDALRLTRLNACMVEFDSILRMAESHNDGMLHASSLRKVVDAVFSSAIEAAAAPTEPRAADFKLLRRMPNTAMVEAGRAAMESEKFVSHMRAVWTWNAMWDAAPKIAVVGEDYGTEIPAAPPAQVAGEPSTASDVYYVQDSRATCGNDVFWWREGGAGYSTDLREAAVFSKAQAYKMHAFRHTDLPWPKAYIDTKARPTVDIQHIDISEATRVTDVRGVACDHKGLWSEPDLNGDSVCRRCGTRSRGSCQ